MRGSRTGNNSPRQLPIGLDGWGRLFGAAALRAGWSIVAVGTSGFGVDGGNLIGDAAGGEWAALGAVEAQLLDDVFVVLDAIVACEAGKGLGQNIVVVYVFQTRLAGDIEPQAMEQDDVFVLHGGCVRTDAEGVDDAVGLNDLQDKLAFGFRYGLPGSA